MEIESTNSELLAEFDLLWQEADQLWEVHREKLSWYGYVSADYQLIYNSLYKLKDSVTTVLEWGSGLGIVTIMASRMGFEAYGIESEPELVDHALDFAEKYGPEAQFAEGSFIPDGFEWQPAGGDEVNQTDIAAAAAYDQFDMELRDFDLVYAYPWPNEHSLFDSIMRQCGGRHSMFLTYDVREGISLKRIADEL